MKLSDLAALWKCSIEEVERRLNQEEEICLKLSEREEKRGKMLEIGNFEIL